MSAEEGGDGKLTQWDNRKDGEGKSVQMVEAGSSGENWTQWNAEQNGGAQLMQMSAEEEVEKWLQPLESASRSICALLQWCLSGAGLYVTWR